MDRHYAKGGVFEMICTECGSYNTVLSFDVGYKAVVLKCIKCQKVIKVYPSPEFSDILGQHLKEV